MIDPKKWKTSLIAKQLFHVTIITLLKIANFSIKRFQLLIFTFIPLGAAFSLDVLSHHNDKDYEDQQ